MKEYKLKINGNNYNVVIHEFEGSSAKLEVNGSEFNVEIDRPVAESAPKVKISKPAATEPAPQQTTVAKPSAAPVAGGTKIISPLPGIIVDILVKPGDAVKKGQKLMILEAMKMENMIESSADGTIGNISVNKGDSVLEGTLLITIG